MTEHVDDSDAEYRDKIDSIPQPPAQSPIPDSDTQAGIDSEAVDEMTTLILMAVGGLGIFLVVIGASIHYRIWCAECGLNESAKGVNSQAQVFEPGQSLPSPHPTENQLEQMKANEELIEGVGIELAASAIVLFLVFKFVNKTKKAKIWVGSTVVLSLLLTCIPLFCPSGFVADLMMAVGTEFFGAAIIFSLVDNVLRQHQRNSNARL